MSNEIIYVESSAGFPSWKNPCPKCGSRYEKGKKSGVSSTRDGSRAWCYGCQTNWKIGQDPRPAGWDELGEKLGVKTEPKPVDGIMILADNFEALRKDFNDRMDNMAAYISKESKKLQDGMDVVQDKLNKLSILDQE